MILSLLLTAVASPELILRDPELREVYGVKDNAIYYTRGYESAYHQWPSGKMFPVEKDKAWVVLGVDGQNALITRAVEFPEHLGGGPTRYLGNEEWPPPQEFQVRGSWALSYPTIGGEPYMVYHNCQFASQFPVGLGKKFCHYALCDIDGSICRVQFKETMLISNAHLGNSKYRWSAFSPVVIPENAKADEDSWNFYYSGKNRLVGLVNITLGNKFLNDCLVAVSLKSHQARIIRQLQIVHGDLENPNHAGYCVTENFVYYIEKGMLWRIRL